MEDDTARSIGVEGKHRKKGQQPVVCLGNSVQGETSCLLIVWTRLYISTCFPLMFFSALVVFLCVELMQIYVDLHASGPRQRSGLS